MDRYKTSRICYIIEADVEYLISILVAGAYLAKLAEYLGIPDNVTGVLNSLVSLGCSFQILSLVFFKKPSVKKGCIIIQTISQILFSLLYMTPLFGLKLSITIPFFAITLTAGHILSQVVAAPKTAWLMGLVNQDKRGVYTANREIVSLLSGMAFSFLMSRLLDEFEISGKIAVMFRIITLVLIFLTIIHALSLILAKEKETLPLSEKPNIRNILKDKRILAVIFTNILYKIANYASVPFFYTYQIKELGFSLTFIAVLGILYSVVRASVSRLCGRIADRYSFRNLLIICFSIITVAFFINSFTCPSNGKIVYTIYYTLDAIAMAGINSGTINLMLENTTDETSAIALALQNSFSGVLGFLSSFVCSFLLSSIQKNGLILFGQTIYAQQILSLVSSVLCFGAILVLWLCLKDKKTQNT